MNCPSGASREVIRVLVADPNELQSQRLSSVMDPRRPSTLPAPCENSLFRIYDKLDVSNRVELVLFALTHRGTERVSSPLAKAVGSCFHSTSKHLDDRISTHKVEAQLRIEEELQRHLRAPLQRMGVHDSNSRNSLED